MVERRGATLADRTPTVVVGARKVRGGGSKYRGSYF